MKTGIKLPASALGYAISFMLLTGLICSGLLFIAGTHKRIEKIHNQRENLCFDNRFALNYGASYELPLHDQMIHPSGDTSQIYSCEWGAYRIIHVETQHPMGRRYTTALSGKEHQKDLPSLYLVDHQQALKIGGNTRIEGVAAFSERGIERAYIAGKNYANEKLLFGTQTRSHTYLPALKKSIATLSFNQLPEEHQVQNWTAHDSTYSFRNQCTVLSQTGSITIRQNLRGNVIIRSFDSIFVAAEARLEHVRLIAPVICFEKGFSGTVQASASRKIICETEVLLKYPSALCLLPAEGNGETGAKSEIRLAEKCQVLGGILIRQSLTRIRNLPYLYMAPESLVAGLIYNTGETEMHGESAGHLFTNYFTLSAGGGQYTNHLLDARIGATQLPEEFILPEWLETQHEQKSKIIAWFGSSAK